MLGERLTTLRKKRGLTQKQLALQLHLSTGTIAMYETDKRKLDMDKICLFCDFYHISADYLLGRTNTSESCVDLDNNISPDQKELIQLYAKLSPISKGRALERLRILADNELRQRIKGNKISG